jgi:hypothetical protein
MSVVISFRLNPENPREAQALEILRTKQKEGFLPRRVLTDALIGLATSKEQNPFLIDEFNTALEQVSGLLERLNSSSTDSIQSTRPQDSALDDTFLSSVRVAVKPGLKMDQ